MAPRGDLLSIAPSALFIDQHDSFGLKVVPDRVGFSKIELSAGFVAIFDEFLYLTRTQRPALFIMFHHARVTYLRLAILLFDFKVRHREMVFGAERFVILVNMRDQFFHLRTDRVENVLELAANTQMQAVLRLFLFGTFLVPRTFASQTQFGDFGVVL
jgi:hypothetical protein